MKSSRVVGVCVVLALAGSRPGTAGRRLRDASAWQAVPPRCDRITSLRLPNATITSATEVAAGAFTPPSATPGRGDGARPRAHDGRAAGVLQSRGHEQTDR